METRPGIDDRRRGPSEPTRRDLTQALAHVMADTYVLYFQTQSFHWNVRGPNFHSLHEMFEEQYEGLAEAVDELAERMRALEVLAPTSLAEITSLARIPRQHGAPRAHEMVAILLDANTHLARDAKRGAELAEQLGDGVTHDLLIARAEAHEKAAWMLRATLEA